VPSGKGTVRFRYRSGLLYTIHSLAPHRRELVSPEEVPSGVVACIRDPRVEAHLDKFPSLPRANLLGESCNVGIGIRVAEGFAGSVKQVLAVDKDDRTLDWRPAAHAQSAKITPPETLRCVERGASGERAGSK